MIRKSVGSAGGFSAFNMTRNVAPNEKTSIEVVTASPAICSGLGSMNSDTRMPAVQFELRALLDTALDQTSYSLQRGTGNYWTHVRAGLMSGIYF